MIHHSSQITALFLIGLFCAPFAARADDASPAAMVYPYAVAADKDGTLFVVDRNLPGVWKIAEGKLSLFHQAKQQLRTPLNVPRCAAIDSAGRLLVGCSPTRDVYRFDGEGKPVGLTGGGANGIGVPMGIGVGKDGEIFVSDLEQHCLWKISKDGGKPLRFASVPAPRGLFVDANQNIWVVSTGQDSLYRVSPDGKLEAVLKGRVFNFPSNVAVDEKGAAYVCDSYAKAIWKVPAGGEPKKLVEGEPFVFPVGLAWMNDGLVVADPKAKAIFRVTVDGKVEAVDAKHTME